MVRDAPLCGAPHHEDRGKVRYGNSRFSSRTRAGAIRDRSPCRRCRPYMRITIPALARRARPG
jgi:hypothetical protein